ncbi:hypothetical protein JCM10207_003846 [Rhodosporidiobolus poonsookiae]
MSLRTSRSRASSLSGSSRPTTPLRRLSSSSLRASSLRASASTSHPASDPLAHLAPLFAELADAVADLAHNADQLDRLADKVRESNEAFAAWLLGLRANGYTVDFLDAPARVNFDLHEERIADRERASSAAFLASHQQQQAHDSDASPPASPSRAHQHAHAHAHAASETTFVTNDEPSFVDGGEEPPRSGSAARGGRGAARGGAAARGRGGKAVGGPVTKRRKEEMAAFADPILPLLPISLRENRRMECERVLWALKERAGGAAMADLTAALSSGPAHTAVPQVRINEVLLALVRAKVVVKALVKGVAQYRLDPSRVAL